MSSKLGILANLPDNLKAARSIKNPMDILEWDGKKLGLSWDQMFVIPTHPNRGCSKLLPVFLSFMILLSKPSESILDRPNSDSAIW